MNPDRWQSLPRPEPGRAVCFSLASTVRLSNGEELELDEQGFLICHEGRLRAWLNRCPHAGSPLDWEAGSFFDESGKRLLCHTHHALFDPLSGDCLSGPCPHGLRAIELREAGERVWVPRRLPPG